MKMYLPLPVHLNICLSIYQYIDMELDKKIYINLYTCMYACVNRKVNILNYMRISITIVAHMLYVW